MEKFIFEAGSKTIRLMPENYLIGYPRYGRMGWTADIDMAVPMKLAIKTFQVLRKNYFEAMEEQVVNELNKLL